MKRFDVDALKSKGDRLKGSGVPKIPSYKYPVRSEYMKKEGLQMVHGTAPKKESTMYTGTNMIGVATLHKSNAVPVFSDEDAKDISSMRR